jgi:transposase
MSKQPLISIPLDIPDVQLLQTDQTQAGELILTVESTLESTTCRQCGRTITEQHGVDKARLLRHLPILGRPVFLRLRPKRFRCPYCDDHPTTTQQLDWYDPQALHTKAYERHLIVQLINSTITDVTDKEDVSYDAMLGILDRWIAKTVDWASLDTIVTLGIDEIALTKGQRDFVAIITGQSASGHLHVLAVLEDRLKATVVNWLKAIPKTHRAQITTVCTDMWEGYVSAAREVLPTATVVIDRFHVARQYREAVDGLRKKEVRRLYQELPKEQHEDLKHTLWPLRKRPPTSRQMSRAV